MFLAFVKNRTDEDINKREWGISGKGIFPFRATVSFLKHSKGEHPSCMQSGRANSNLDDVLGGGNSLSWGQNQEFHLARRWIPLWRQAFGPGPFSSFTARLARENLLTYPCRRLTALLPLLGVYWLFRCVKTRLKLASLLGIFRVFRYTYSVHNAIY